MRSLWAILVLLVFLGFGVSLAVPAEDVPETAYDESEGLPYEGTPLFSVVVPQAAARTTRAVPNSSRDELGAPSPLPSAGVCDADALRPANARNSLALCCTLLC